MFAVVCLRSWYGVIAEPRGNPLFAAGREARLLIAPAPRHTVKLIVRDIRNSNGYYQSVQGTPSYALQWFWKKVGDVSWKVVETTGSMRDRTQPLSLIATWMSAKVFLVQYSFKDNLCATAHLKVHNSCRFCFSTSTKRTSTSVG
eukprot:1085649-Prorocentrum_minimum.AAC.1